MMIWGRSAPLLRRWPLAALAATLAGSAASMVLQPRPSYPLVVLACAVGLEICYITRLAHRASQ